MRKSHLRLTVLGLTTIMAISSCGQQESVVIGQNASRESSTGSLTDSETSYTMIQFPRLVSAETISRLIPGESLKIGGAQYYISGGTGGINTTGSPLHSKAFFQQVLDGFASKKDVFEKQFLSRTKRDAHKLSISQMTSDPLNYQTATELIELKNKSVAFGSIQPSTPLFYSIYVSGSSEQISKLSNTLNGMLVDGIGRKLKRQQPDYVQRAYQDHLKASRIDGSNKITADKAKSLLFRLNEGLRDAGGPTLDEIRREDDGSDNLKTQSSTTLTWWPGGNVEYDPYSSYYGTKIANVYFGMAWGSARLTNIRSLKSDDRIFNLDAFEGDFVLLGSARYAYSGCDAYTSLPAGYDDCITAGVDEVGQSVSMGFGSFDNNQFLANTTYDATVTMYAGSSQPAIGTYLPTNVTFQAVHCYSSLSVWNCGLSAQEKISKRVLDQASMNIKFHQNYYQTWY